MKEIQFKIIELPLHQVLIYKDFDSEEECDSMVIIFFIEGVKCSNTFGYPNEEIRDKTFNEITELQVQKLADNAIKMFN